MRVVFYFFSGQLHCLHARTEDDRGNETGREALVNPDYNDWWDEVACDTLGPELDYWKGKHEYRSFLVFQSLESALEYAIEHHPGRATTLLAGLL